MVAAAAEEEEEKEEEAKLHRTYGMHFFPLF
jgi:hypothetical protein